MKIKLNDCFGDGYWYTIIRAEHDGREWIENIDTNTSRFMCSERLSPEACIEGTKEEMLDVAKAIKNNGLAKYKRVAVSFAFGGFVFWSPKNSEHEAFISVEDADEFAEQVFKELK